MHIAAFRAWIAVVQRAPKDALGLDGLTDELALQLATGTYQDE